MPIYDIHAHVYPDAIADKASDTIGKFYEIPMEGDGCLKTLLDRSAAAGITKNVIHSAAVTPNRVEKINDFLAGAAASCPERLIGFGTLHAGFEKPAEEVRRMMDLGLRGVKLHPDFQYFYLDEDSSMEMFRAIADAGLPVIVHVGDYRHEYSHPERMARVLKAIPDLRAVCAHMGGWSMWNDAWKVLAGLPNAWCDCSSSLYALKPGEAAEIIRHWGRERVFFGTDFPMWDPVSELVRFRALPLTEEEKECILWKNLQGFLNI